MIILFTICGRAGSKGFKNKNLKELNGVPLVYYTLGVIKEYIDKHQDDKVFVAVNSDSSALVDIAIAQKELPIIVVERKKELAGDMIAKVEVIKDTFLFCRDYKPDVVIDLDITSPMRSAGDIENIIAEYKKGVYDLVFSVVESRRSPYFNMVENKTDGYYRKVCASNYTARQQAPKVYELNASIYAYKPEFLSSNIDKTILDYNCGISVMTDYLVLDIDSEEDFEMMSHLHKYYCETDMGIKSVYDSAKRLMLN